MNSAEYRGPHFGYVSMAFEVEYRNEMVMWSAEAALKYSQENIIKMHKFVMNKIFDKNKIKTILVDAVNTFVIKGEGIFEEMYNLLESYPNRKIILTNADDEQMDKFGLNKMPYEVFTLKHNPEKTEPKYYEKMLEHFSLSKEEVLYFEHNEDAVNSARSVGINTYHYDKDKKDLETLKKFLEANF